MPGVDARQAPAGALGALVLAAHLVHVGGRAADVGDGPAEALHARERAHLAQDAVGAAALDDAPLVLGDAAERAAAEAAAHRDDRVLDVSNAGMRSLAVARVRARVNGQIVEPVHLRFVERQRGRVEVHGLVAVRLEERARVVGVGLVLERATSARTPACRRATSSYDGRTTGLPSVT